MQTLGKTILKANVMVITNKASKCKVTITTQSTDVIDITSTTINLNSLEESL